MINESIFKAYDIRGIYPEQLNEETAKLIGKAFIKLTNAKKVVVGRDTRLASPALSKAAIRGMLSMGANVDNLELVPVDAIYFTAGKFGYDGGIYITASHNPKEYDGFKMIDKNGDVIRGVKLKEVILLNDFETNVLPGALNKKNITNDYLKHILSFVNLNKIKPLKVVVDASNGMAGKIISLLQPQLPTEIIALNFELDGSFPNHAPNPLETGAMDMLSQKIIESKADLGVIFDGDSDRLFFMDETGNFIKADITLLVLAKHFLKTRPGSAIVYNAVCSKAVPEFVKKWGGKPVKSKVGYVNVREKMKQNQAVLSGELSAHYAFKDNYYSDSGIIAFLILLQLISEDGRPLSEITKELTIYAKANEVNIEVKDR
jgi:phosphomannomutase